jgi:hypothetical protein
MGKIINQLLRLNKDKIETFDDHFMKFSYQMIDTDPNKRPSLKKTIEMIKNIKIETNIDVEKEGYFTDFASKYLIYIFCGKEDWNSYWVDDKGVYLLKQVKNDTYQIIVEGREEYATLVWNEDCWIHYSQDFKKTFRKSKKVHRKSDGYFNNFDETYFFLKLNCHKTNEKRPLYLITKDSAHLLTQESIVKYKFGKHLFEWNGYCWREFESKFEKLFINKESTKKEGYFQNITRKIYIHLGITNKSKCYFFEGKNYFELSQNENLSSVNFNDGKEEFNLIWCGYGWKMISVDQEMFFQKLSIEEANENAFFNEEKSIFMVKSSEENKYFKITQESVEIVEMDQKEIFWNGKYSWKIYGDSYTNQRMLAFHSNRSTSPIVPKIVVIGVSGAPGKF